MIFLAITSLFKKKLLQIKAVAPATANFFCSAVALEVETPNSLSFDK
jgi:hypothetical protein